MQNSKGSAWNNMQPWLASHHTKEHEGEMRVERWTEMPRCGHFAALEEPELLVEEMQAFFRELKAKH